MKRNRRLFSAYEMELLARIHTPTGSCKAALFTAGLARFGSSYERGGDVQQIFENRVRSAGCGYTVGPAFPKPKKKWLRQAAPFTEGFRAW
jgi:hypothetical protein